jgi:hypothetical protein
VTTSSQMRKSEVGEVRPSQTLTTFGIGSLVDLPNMSVIVMGLDDWPSAHSNEIAEGRLLRSAQSILGPQVTRFLTPPRGPELQGSQTNWFDEARQIGVPVAPFPRWMVCSKCRLLAPISSGLFEPKVYPYRPDRACYVHNCTTQGRSPLVVPARFMVTCEHGHLDDFPWVDFVHHDTTKCKGLLYLYEVGASGEALDVEVKCDGCGSRRRMGQAFGPNNRLLMPPCRGRRPQLRDVDPNGCDQDHVKPMLQGASNLWFPVLISALSVPQASDDLGRLVEENWVVLEKATSLDVLKAFRLIGQLKDLSKYTDDQIWTAIQNRRNGKSSRTRQKLRQAALSNCVASIRQLISPNTSRRSCSWRSCGRFGRLLALPASCRQGTLITPLNCLPDSGPESLAKTRRGFPPARHGVRGSSSSSPSR